MTGLLLKGSTKINQTRDLLNKERFMFGVSTFGIFKMIISRASGF
jgi:hypothetical protein